MANKANTDLEHRINETLRRSDETFRRLPAGHYDFLEHINTIKECAEVLNELELLNAELLGHSR